MNITLKTSKISLSAANNKFSPTGLEPLREFADICKVLDANLETLETISDVQTKKRVAQMRRKISVFEPCVTVIGQVKAGKTSLLNTMIGWPDLLPADVNPWTSVVTSLHLNPQKTAHETASKFRFFSADEWDSLLAKGGRLGELAQRAGAEDEMEKLRDQLSVMQEKSRIRMGRKFETLLGQEHEYHYFDQELIERYVCLGEMAERGKDVSFGDAQGRFADITKSADLYIHRPTIPTKLCFRDTPGVNDTFMIREQITIQAIRDSRLCVVVLSAHQALSSVDMALIRLITNVKSRDVLIFVNRIDELPFPDQQIPEIRQSILNTLKKLNGPENPEIIFGSAFWANCVLTGQTVAIDGEIARGLSALPEFRCEGDVLSGSALNWHFSGVPSILRSIGHRIVEDEGAELVAQIVQSGMNLANGMKQVDKTVILDPKGSLQSNMDRTAVTKALNQIEHHCLDTLENDFENIKTALAARLEISHNSFLDRATGSLVDHLEMNGEDQLWEYSPDGLRMMLNSAYVVFGSKLKQVNTHVFQTCSSQVAALYQEAFSSIVKFAPIDTPPPPRLPPAVFLGQTIALDLKGPWWKGWWQKRKGRQAFAKSFHHLIKAETDPIVEELKSRQTEIVKADLIKSVGDFFADQRAIFAAISDRSGMTGEQFEKILSGRDNRQTQSNLDAVLAAFNQVREQQMECS